MYRLSDYILRFKGFSDYLAGLLGLLIRRKIPTRPFRGIASRVRSPVTSTD